MSACSRQRVRTRARLAVELGPLKAQWEAYCQRTGVSASEAVRLLVGRELGSVSHTAQRFVPADIGAPRQRIEIRLTPNEFVALRDVADATGFSVNRWLVAMVRAQLASEPQFGQHELAVLAASNSQLAAIGRNLNQIARALNAHELVEAYRLKVLETLKTEVDTHLDAVNRIIRANLDRWNRGA
jgi:hypothetical protein